MRDVIIEIVRNMPAMLAAFQAIVRFGDDDDERLNNLESIVADLKAKLDEVHALIEHKKQEKA